MLQRAFAISALVGVAAVLLRCSDGRVTAPDEYRFGVLEKTGTEGKIVESDNTFGFALFKEINKQEGDTNLLISPFSVSLALAMTLNGAQGKTREEMIQTLALEELTNQEVNEACRSLVDLLKGLDPEVVLEVANSIWYLLGFDVKQGFLDANMTYYDAEVEGLDFSDPGAKDTINGWVAEKTQDKITEIIEEISPLDVMFVINATYFKGAWAQGFDKDATRAEEFTRSDGSKVSCQMMALSSDELRYLETEDFEAVDLPYGNSLYSMVIVLPKQTAQLDEVITELTHEKWVLWMTSLTPKKGLLKLPKFKVEYGTDLVDTLPLLGMKEAFTEAADFGLINDTESFWITQVLHNTFVDVNEEATEAAAVTVVTLGKGVTEGFYMKVDRPFLFAICERHTGAILFLGKVVEPK